MLRSDVMAHYAASCSRRLNFHEHANGCLVPRCVIQGSLVAKEALGRVLKVAGDCHCAYD
jgi:hypothetical protein